ncbi:MAG: hypothetical protein LHV69_09790 [Elusimicrobia bacterium]|nr:hypothetical protein [Candidatus Obscuribacterium magneticum]
MTQDELLEAQVQTRIVRRKAHLAITAIKSLAVESTNPGMEDEIHQIVKQIEGIRDEMIKDLSDPDWEYR